MNPALLSHKSARSSPTKGRREILDDLGKVRPNGAGGVIGVVGNLARTVGRDLARPGIDLGVDAIVLDQAADAVNTASAALIAGDRQDFELADRRRPDACGSPPARTSIWSILFAAQASG
jgi:hypothetical protein